MPTTPTQFRLTDADLAELDRLRERYSLSTRTEAVRLAVNLALSVKVSGPKKPPRKPRT
jgi:hypothetical protein